MIEALVSIEHATDWPSVTLASAIEPPRMPSSRAYSAALAPQRSAERPRTARETCVKRMPAPHLSLSLNFA
jgi:hypothetical protein